MASGEGEVGPELREICLSLGTRYVCSASETGKWRCPGGGREAWSSDRGMWSRVISLCVRISLPGAQGCFGGGALKPLGIV